MRYLPIILLLISTDLFAADGSGLGTDEAIQAWHDLAGTVDGDTYTIDAGTHDIDVEVDITKQVKLIGAGVGSTILVDKVSGASAKVFDITVGAGGTFEMRGIQFDADSPAQGGNNAIIQIKGTGEVKIGNIEFSDGLDRRPFSVTSGAVTGVIYSVTNLADKQMIYCRNGIDWGGGVWGDGSWAGVVNYGTDEFLFIEDCVQGFDGTPYSNAFHDGDGGGRVVFRYNTGWETFFSVHGTESSLPRRGGRAYEIYNNTFDHNGVAEAKSWPVVMRSGTAIVHNNTFLGFSDGDIHLASYRDSVDFNVLGSADGTMLWDANDLTDGEGTPGGPGDGVFESGTSTGGGTSTITDTGQSWTVNEWAGYTLRQRHDFTATSGALNSITVSGAGWTADEWVGFVVTRESDDKKSQVDSNTTDTLTLKGGAGNWEDLTFSTDDFHLSRGVRILSNTSDTITIDTQGGFLQPDNNPGATARREAGGNYIFASGDGYEIRRVLKMLDQSGRGLSDPWVGTRPTNEDLGQHSNPLDPCYEWNNTHDGGAMGFDFGVGVEVFESGTDYFDDTAKPGYTAYTYPHPLRGAQAASISIQGSLRVGP